MLVLGQEASQHGLALSLLERLQRCYANSGAPAAVCYTSSLNTNYRSHRAILKLAEELFYKIPMTCTVPESSTHPSTPYPLIFVCSSIDEAVTAVSQAYNEGEALITLQQVVDLMRSWPVGGPTSPQELCLVSPHRSQVHSCCCSTPAGHPLTHPSLPPQVTLFSQLAPKMLPPQLRRITRCPTYDIQGDLT